MIFFTVKRNAFFAWLSFHRSFVDVIFTDVDVGLASELLDFDKFHATNQPSGLPIHHSA